MPDSGGPLVLPEEGNDHADQNGEHRAAHHLKPLPQQPGGHGDHQAGQDSQGILSDKFHDMRSFLSRLQPVYHITA